jgi:hypothetical protein
MWGWVDDLAVSTANSDPSDDAFTSENDEYTFTTPVHWLRGVLKDAEPSPVVSVPCILGHNLSPAPLNRRLKEEGRSFSARALLLAFMSLQC